MKRSGLFAALLTTLTLTAFASADSIDMDDPRRTVGREDNVRIDAQLVKDTVTPGSPIGVTWQIENLSANPIAVADKVADATYDADTQTITFAIGAEVPQDGKMPHVVTVKPGEKKLFRSGAIPALSAAATRTSLAPPRYVQVKVSILRDPAAFANTRADEVLSDELFDKWFEANDSIFLNAVPVRFSSRESGHNFAGADQRGGGF
ncbi:MAG TPA: hypothetical protein VEK79_03955 [Thermoanaerobaculia bacterium]|nr:hypothetical protein [Thermoanaerobaculia bacterium]